MPRYHYLAAAAMSVGANLEKPSHTNEQMIHARMCTPRFSDTPKALAKEDFLS